MFCRIVAGAVLGWFVLSGLAHAQDENVDWLFMQEAESLEFSGNTLTLLGFSPDTLMFTDRPHRAAMYLPVAKFVALWKGADFGEDPPNAGLSAVVDGKLVTAVVELNVGRLESDSLRYEVTVLGGALPASATDVVLFVDAFPTAVNDQITDAITQRNTEVLGDAPAVSMGNLFEATSQALAEAASADSEGQ